MLRNPEARDMRIAHVRSSLVGWSPPKGPRDDDERQNPTEPTISFTSKAVEPVTLATDLMRTAASRFGARSTKLSGAKSNLHQIGSKATSARESPRGMA